MSDTQLQTLRLYKQLLDHKQHFDHRQLLDPREDWGGSIVFSCGPEAPRSGIAPAASIAGAASLLVAEDGHEVKKAFRRGEIDFVVNSLDEAVRALKNEVRRRRPLSVALIAEVEPTLAEMAGRGLQPDVYVARGGAGEQPPGLQPLIERGMARLTIGDEAAEAAGSMLISHGERHEEYFLPTATPTKLREADARLLRTMPKDELLRRRWVERASHYLRSATEGRWAWLSEGEAALLASEGLTVRSRDEELRPRSPEESQPTAL